MCYPDFLFECSTHHLAITRNNWYFGVKRIKDSDEVDDDDEDDEEVVDEEDEDESDINMLSSSSSTPPISCRENMATWLDSYNAIV